MHRREDNIKKTFFPDLVLFTEGDKEGDRKKVCQPVLECWQVMTKGHCAREFCIVWSRKLYVLFLNFISADTFFEMLKILQIAATVK
jgi:hypothetical protein